MTSTPAPQSGIEVAPRVFIDHSSLRFQFARSGGPGGQNVNKLNTKAELWAPVLALRGLRQDAVDRLRAIAGHRLTAEDEIHIIAEEHRSQSANVDSAMQRLRELLIQAMHRPKRRRATRPTRSSVRRRLEEKKRRGQIKQSRRNED